MTDSKWNGPERAPGESIEEWTQRYDEWLAATRTTPDSKAGLYYTDSTVYRYTPWPEHGGPWGCGDFHVYKGGEWVKVTPSETDFDGMAWIEGQEADDLSLIHI